MTGTATAPPESSVISVAIVDQHPAFARGLWSILDMAEGFLPVANLGSGREALQTVSRQRPRLVTIGLGLRDLAPVALCRELRTVAPGVRVALFVDASEFGELDRCLGILPAIALLRDSGHVEIIAALRRLADGWSAGNRDGLRSPDEIRGDGQRSHSLTDRDCEILRLVAKGLTSREIAKILVLAPNTIRSYCQCILRKLGARNRVQAIEVARSLGVL